MTSGPNSPNLNPMDWGQCWNLEKGATEAKSSSRVLKSTLVNLVCITEENHR